MHMSLEISLGKFVDYTDHASEPNVGHRVFLSHYLDYVCRSHSAGDTGYGEVATSFVDAAVRNLHPGVRFPTFLWPHPWHPFVMSCRSDDGRIPLYLCAR